MAASVDEPLLIEFAGMAGRQRAVLCSARLGLREIRLHHEGGHGSLDPTDDVEAKA
jgi:hypothetical protein